MRGARPSRCWPAQYISFLGMSLGHRRDARVRGQPPAPGRPPQEGRRGRRPVDGARGDVHVVLRARDRQAVPWEADIPAYLFAGGLAAGSSLLAAGADLTASGAAPPGRLGAIGALSFSMVALVHDLGRPERFLNMLRVVKLTSPMSVGSGSLDLRPVRGRGAPPSRDALGDRAAVRCGWRRTSTARPVCSPGCSRRRWRRTPRSCSPTPHRLVASAYRELPFFVSAAAASGASPW